MAPCTMHELVTHRVVCRIVAALIEEEVRNGTDHARCSPKPIDEY